MNKTLTLNIKITIKKGFSLIKNLQELKVPNLTVYNLDKRSGREP